MRGGGEEEEEEKEENENEEEEEEEEKEINEVRSKGRKRIKLDKEGRGGRWQKVK